MTRVKLLPRALVLATFALPLGLTAALSIVMQIVCETPLNSTASVAEIGLLAASLVFAVPLARTVRRIADPDEVVIDRERLTVKTLGKTVSLPWRKVGSVACIPGRMRVSPAMIRIGVDEPGTKAIDILVEEYPFSHDDLTRAIEQGRNGIVILMPAKLALGSDRYLSLPLSIFTASIFPVLALRHYLA